MCKFLDYGQGATKKGPRTEDLILDSKKQVQEERKRNTGAESEKRMYGEGFFW